MSANIELIENSKRVTQAYGFDKKSKMIALTHYINLKEGEDAYLEEINKYSPDDKNYDFGTLFIYRIINKQPDEDTIPFVKSKKFPVNGFPYRLSGDKHEIKVMIEPSQN